MCDFQCLWIVLAERFSLKSLIFCLLTDDTLLSMEDLLLALEGLLSRSDLPPRGVTSLSLALGALSSDLALKGRLPLVPAVLGRALGGLMDEKARS